MEIQLRPAQEEIMAYEGGLMAVSAVPGSGKTFTLSLLAARLLAEGMVDATAGEQVLIVTYLNASVDAFKARIRQRLLEMGLPLAGFDVRTLHSLGLEIVRTAAGGASEGEERQVLADAQASHFLSRATSSWIEDNPAHWRAFLPDESNARMRARWQTITENTARHFIRTAKNKRFPPSAVQARLQAALDAETAPPDAFALLWMLNGIYMRYQNIVARQGASDFDDLIWEAVDLLENRPDLTHTLRQRWPYVLEDEAQDSVPLQEALLSALAGAAGNWVRVGDPNQAITSTFTAAHPRHFNAFLNRPDVVVRPLPNSGRSAPRIIGAANTLLNWVIDSHPVPEVRESTFRRQNIRPAPPGDAQQNPADQAGNIRIKVFSHREEEELPAIAHLAVRYAKTHPDHTLAVLVPTNNVGYELAEWFDRLDADYDNLLRGGLREREVASVLHALLSVLANPLDTKALVAAHESLLALGHPAAGPVPIDLSDDSALASDQASPEIDRFHALLRSTHRPETLLYPLQGESAVDALPQGIATAADLRRLEPFLKFLRRIFALRELPIDDLALSLADEVFAHSDEDEGHVDFDLAVSYQLANLLRRWRDLEPEWRLPELVEQLGDIAAGRRSLPGSGPAEGGFEPEPGRISLATQHSAKGMEWDAVYLVGIDSFWIPGSLDAPFLGVHDFLGGDPAAEATAQLDALMESGASIVGSPAASGRTATQLANIEVISERLRLLYVGITRARRFLHISRSRMKRRYNRDEKAEPATVMGVLYRYLEEERGS